MTDGRLALLQSGTQSGHMKFSFTHEVHQDAQSSSVGEQFECLNEVFFQFTGQAGGRGITLDFGHGTDHFMDL